jgi:two-component system, LuxR family, response regulator FixJ
VLANDELAVIFYRSWTRIECSRNGGDPWEAARRAVDKCGAMNNKADPIAYRAYLNRDRLIYLTHPDVTVARQVCDAFVTRGFQVSIMPDSATLDQMADLRRPDLVILPMACDGAGLTSTLNIIASLREKQLGIHSFVLAPAQLRAEPVVAAVRHGASAVFSPPYESLEILRAAEDLFRADLRLERREDGGDEVTVGGFGALTHREREVLRHVVRGETNKEIAANLGLSYRTVEVHRRHIMEKVGARNAAELVRLAIES